MTRGRWPVALAIVALTASPVWAKKKRKKKKPEPAAWTFALAAEAEVVAGALSGHGTIREGGGFVRASAEATPSLKRRWLTLELPVSIEDRETVGTHLPERSGDLDAELELRQGPRLRGSVHGGIAATWRPDWPDPYQPLAGGELGATSRQSHWDREVGAEIAGIPLRHQHARLQYDHTIVDYDDDDAYDPIDAPTHLVPGDHTDDELEASWKHHADSWKLGGSVELLWERWSKAYARDAGTGLTHAGTGGPPPNPLQRTFTITPAVVGEVTLGRVEVSAEYGVAFSDDLYAGYYSYIEQRPELGVETPLPGGLHLEAEAALRWRRYGANSYAPEPPDRPALDFGERRSDRAFDLDVDLRRSIARHVDAVAGLDLRIRRTNYPDYVPGVYPQNRTYDIDWDYDDVTVWLGVAWTHDGADGK